MAHASEKEQFFNVFIIKEGIKTDGQRRLLEKIRRNLCAFCFKIQALLWNRMTLNFEEVFIIMSLTMLEEKTVVYLTLLIHIMA